MGRPVEWEFELSQQHLCGDPEGKLTYAKSQPVRAVVGFEPVERVSKVNMGQQQESVLLSAS